MATILDEWHPGDLLIAALRACGIVLLIGGIVLILLGLLGGCPDLLNETRFHLDLRDQGVVYASPGRRFARPAGRSAACWGGGEEAPRRTAPVVQSRLLRS